MNNHKFSRRSFLKLSAITPIAYQTMKFDKFSQFSKNSFLATSKLGRAIGGLNIRKEPHYQADLVGDYNEDDIFEYYEEVIGEVPYWTNQTWYRVANGYVWSGFVQSVKNNPVTSPLLELPDTNTKYGKGYWAEVCIPYIDLDPGSEAVRSPSFVEADKYRLYYGQVVWVKDVMQLADGRILHKISEWHGTYGDEFWVDAQGLRQILPEDISTINPGVADKKVIVDLSKQTLSCFEGPNEVFYTRIASGVSPDFETPVGLFTPHRRLISLHMSGNITGDYPAVGWTTMFTGSGVSIHSAHWHNTFGKPTSHGCINCKPSDAKWIFRWVEPAVPYVPGDISMDMSNPYTKVQVIE